MGSVTDTDGPVLHAEENLHETAGRTFNPDDMEQNTAAQKTSVRELGLFAITILLAALWTYAVGFVQVASYVFFFLVAIPVLIGWVLGTMPVPEFATSPEFVFAVSVPLAVMAGSLFGLLQLIRYLGSQFLEYRKWALISRTKN